MYNVSNDKAIKIGATTFAELNDIEELVNRIKVETLRRLIKKIVI